MWDDIKEVTVKEALQLKNTEDRRTYFDCIGPKRMFEQVKTKQLDRQVVKKKRARWDDKNKEYEYEFEDVYELYKIPYSELFEKPAEKWMRQDDIFVVRCWCTTTGREYWLFVPENGCSETNYTEKGSKITYDAIKAIAWTIRTNITRPERIYRQGDIIVVKASKDSVASGWTRHLSKDDYLSLMYSET
jgi:hypothetical protein